MRIFIQVNDNQSTKLYIPVIFKNINSKEKYQKHTVTHTSKQKFHKQISSKKMEKRGLVRAYPLPDFGEYKKMMDEEKLDILLSQNRCPLSHPTHPHILSRSNGRRTKFGCCFSCSEKTPIGDDPHGRLICKTCNVEFHRGCHTFPRKLTHPYHLQHPLTFSFRNNETGIISDGKIDESLRKKVLSNPSTSESNASDPKKSGSVEVSQSQSVVLFDKCTWCGKNIQGNWFYRCSICTFSLDLSCSKQFPAVFVANPGNHHHSLVFYPRPLLTPCDACGLVNVLEASYACFQCNYMVHKSCIDLPRVIKITRHQHRLFHTPYLPSTISPCRICYKTVDTKYGLYSCNHEDCSYAVHSKCATHENIWDGEELEWEPEYDETEDITPFKKVGSDLIKHFSHEHLLKLKKYDGVRDAEKLCEACVLPINSHDFYNCLQCDFFLHEICAGLLRKLDHALHKHPLVLDPLPNDRFDHNNCSACLRKSTGFRYICSIDFCEVRIDVRCILVPDYFTHKSHVHPLFISTSNEDNNGICCMGCKEICLQSYLQCTVCKFAMCYECATIPTEICYRYDKHPLSLCYGERTDDTYWCEVCEKELNPMDWFYTCNECCITIHLHCLFGSSIYMKPGCCFNYHQSGVEVLRNSNSTRPLCDECGHRCPGYIVYYYHIFAEYLCSLNCLIRGKRMAEYLLQNGQEKLMWW